MVQSWSALSLFEIVLLILLEGMLLMLEVALRSSAAGGTPAASAAEPGSDPSCMALTDVLLTRLLLSGCGISTIIPASVDVGLRICSK